MSELPVYKGHRIHTKRLFSGAWIGTLVNLGKETIPTRHALTDSVTRVPGEYESEDQAIQAARAYIDLEIRAAPE
ncbi:MAG: hypothetical protein EHM71_17220 [Zetaproteobacteria bacterium]|nr:MAG: hypothetical protein EHM71_17220 [Zetaproteobacteria bacterium]